MTDMMMMMMMMMEVQYASFYSLFDDPYTGRTAPLTSKHCILYIYSTNTGTEYFKYTLFFFLFEMQFVS